MSLATGHYKVVPLFARKRKANQPFYVLDFSLLGTGERESAVVLYKDMAMVFTPAGFIMREGCIWSPAEQSDERRVLTLSIVYNPEFKSSRAIAACRTGQIIKCDIGVPIKLPYEEF